MSRALKWLYGLVACLALAYLASPYVSVGRFYIALDGANQTVLRDRVDWDSLRRGFRDDLNRFATNAAENLVGGTAADKGVMLSLTWKSLPLADEVAAVLATPRGLIALYDQSKAIGCMLGGLARGGTSPQQCLERDRLPEARVRHFKLAGPNFRRWGEKFHYAFFTDPFTFRLDLMHGDMRVVLVLVRHGLGWRVARLMVPFDHILRRRQDGPAPAGGKG